MKLVVTGKRAHDHFQVMWDIPLYVDPICVLSPNTQIHQKTHLSYLTIVYNVAGNCQPNSGFPRQAEANAEESAVAHMLGNPMDIGEQNACPLNHQYCKSRRGPAFPMILHTTVVSVSVIERLQVTCL